MEGSKARWKNPLVDCILLFVLVIVPELPFLGGLHFYSDDWAFAADRVQRLHESGLETFRHMVTEDANFRVRPVLAVFMSFSYKVLAFDPLALHILSAILLGLMIAAVYMVARKWGLSRMWALALAMIFGTLPHYSTDRFWISSQQAVFCILFAMIGIYGTLKVVEQGARRRILWGMVAASGLALSFLSYEVVVGMIAAMLLLVGVRTYRDARKSGVRDKAPLLWIGGIILTLFVLGIAKTMLQDRIVYQHHLMRFLGRLGHMAAHGAEQAITFNLWTYGLHLPWAVVRLWQNGAIRPAAVAASCLVGAAVIALLWPAGSEVFWSSRTALKVIAAGFVVYALGVFLFVRSLDSNFSAPGANNRITIAAALGAAMVWVGLVALICRLIPSPIARQRAFSVLIGLSCAANCLVVNGIAWYWMDSARKQDEILQTVKAHVAPLPAKSILMLDGFCRYDGPSPVFETDWDTTSAVRLLYGDFSLTGDVVSSNATFGPEYVDTTLYGDAEGHYPYGKNLYVFNVRDQSLRTLDSREAALRYLREMNPTGNNGCPAARDGDGVKVF